LKSHLVLSCAAPHPVHIRGRSAARELAHIANGQSLLWACGMWAWTGWLKCLLKPTQQECPARASNGYFPRLSFANRLLARLAPPVRKRQRGLTTVPRCEVQHAGIQRGGACTARYSLQFCATAQGRSEDRVSRDGSPPRSVQAAPALGPRGSAEARGELTLVPLPPAIPCLVPSRAITQGRSSYAPRLRRGGNFAPRKTVCRTHPPRTRGAPPVAPLLGSGSAPRRLPGPLQRCGA